MSWYCVYDATTSSAVSFTTSEPGALQSGLSYVAVSAQPDDERAWDAASLSVVTYEPAPADPAGALYEMPTNGAWRWTYAVGPHRLPAKATGVRSTQPTDAAAQGYIRANVPTADVVAAITWATGRRDSIATALAAAGIDPASNGAYTDAQAVLAFLGNCL